MAWRLPEAPGIETVMRAIASGLRSRLSVRATSMSNHPAFSISRPLLAWAAVSGSGNRAVLGGRGDSAEDEADEHLTWLVEDELVWGGSEAPGSTALGVPETPTEG